jgi:hypothetical protein
MLVTFIPTVNIHVISEMSAQTLECCNLVLTQVHNVTSLVKYPNKNIRITSRTNMRNLYTSSYKKIHKMNVKIEATTVSALTHSKHLSGNKFREHWVGLQNVEH